MAHSKFKDERIKQNKTQKDIAAKANVCRTTISFIENGKADNVQLGTLKKLAAALNSDIQTLFLSNN